MKVELKEVHLGQEIKKRLEALKMTKTEFGRLIGVPQQHVNRIFERDTMETKKLVRVCRALDFNFFALYCEFPTQVSAYLAAVSMGDGGATNNVSGAEAIAEMEALKQKVEGQKESISLLRGQVDQLKDQVEGQKSQLRDKDMIIEMLKK